MATQQYLDAKIYFSGFGWFPNEPTNAVAEAFFVRHRGSDTNWVRNFVPRPANSADSPPGIDSYTIRDGTITLKINKTVKRYNVQFSSDRENWVNVATKQTAASWKGALPAGSVGFFQVVQP